MGIGGQELIIIMVIALLIFGPRKLPEMGRSIGAALRELRRASNDFMSAVDDVKSDLSEDEDDKAGE